MRRLRQQEAVLYEALVNEVYDFISGICPVRGISETKLQLYLDRYGVGRFQGHDCRSLPDDTPAGFEGHPRFDRINGELAHPDDNREAEQPLGGLVPADDAAGQILAIMASKEEPTMAANLALLWLERRRLGLDRSNMCIPVLRCKHWAHADEISVRYVFFVPTDSSLSLLGQIVSKPFLLLLLRSLNPIYKFRHAFPHTLGSGLRAKL